MRGRAPASWFDSAAKGFQLAKQEDCARKDELTVRPRSVFFNRRGLCESDNCIASAIATSKKNPMHKPTAVEINRVGCYFNPEPYLYHP